MSELLIRASNFARSHQGWTCVGALALLAILGWRFQWSWGTWILLGVGCAAASEFAGSGNHLTAANARRLTLVAALIVVGAQYMANRESERETRELAESIKKNLETTERSLANTGKSIARLDEMTKMLTGADSIFYIHFYIDEQGDYKMAGRFEGEYPLPVVRVRILDNTFAESDLHKASVVFEETLTHVTRGVQWVRPMPKPFGAYGHEDENGTGYKDNYRSFYIEFDVAGRAVVQRVAIVAHTVIGYALYGEDGEHLTQFDHMDGEAGSEWEDYVKGTVGS